MKELTTTDFQRMIALAFKNIEARAEEFSKLDAALGDGDHGEAIVMAFSVIDKTSKSGGDFKKMLSEMGFAVMLETSGSTSTLLGALLLGMSDKVNAVDTIDADGMREMFRGGLSGVQKNTRAAVGDKTIMDALIPAVEAMEKLKSDDIKELLAAAALAAQTGADATRDMKATFGRARNLGEKTIGHVDAGATSWASIFVSFDQAL
ncbi:MAG: dihydroxyacetone kinase subunit L [Mucinivorans sp.]